VNFLIDTNVVSELTKRRPNPGVLTWASKITGQQQLSAISVDELRFGMARRPDPRIIDWLEQYLRDNPVLPVTREIAERAGAMRGDFSRKGIVREQANMLIAATAQHHNLTLVTRNTRDFENCGIGLLNPFTD
jgi:toxin FitB